ncbi:uncharacterized protein LOC121868720 [Homarus americanus]|nr:uncharacterized protein LOC121868720 [Homarus americanus]
MGGSEGFYQSQYDPQGYTHSHPHFTHPAFSTRPSHYHRLSTFSTGPRSEVSGDGGGSEGGVSGSVAVSSEGEIFDDVDRSEFDRYLKGPERVAAVTASFTYTPPANPRYLQVGGGTEQYQESQFVTLIKEEPDDGVTICTSGAGGGADGGSSDGESKSTDTAHPSPEHRKSDTNTSSLLSALADVRELYYEHS